jgi:LEA14-like dessication related protein
MNKIACFALLVILFTASCRRPKELEYRNIEHFSMNKGGVSMDIRLYNPNNYKLKLKRADADVFVNGNKLGRMVTNAKITLAKRDTATIPVTLAVDLKNALPNIVGLLFNSEVNIKLTGRVKAGRHGVFIAIPINYEGKQDIRSGLKF